MKPILPLTNKQRSAKRRRMLNNLAVATGFSSWRILETAALHGEVEFRKRPAVPTKPRPPIE